MTWTAMLWTFGGVCFAAGWLSRELLQRQRDDRLWRYDESDDDEEYQLARVLSWTDAHPPEAGRADGMCARCGADPLDEIHWPPTRPPGSGSSPPA